MPNLLRIDSSADLAASRSRALTSAFVDVWRARGPEFTVTTRDLHVDQLPHLEASALHWPAGDRQPGAVVPDGAEALQREVIDELLAADVLLVGAPLYNYTVPSTLKAWIDRVHLPGVLARAQPGDPRPLADRPAVVVVSRGGSYDPGTPTEHWDHASPVLRIILGEALGMRVLPVTTSLTLPAAAGAPVELAERGRREFDAARAEVERLAATLG